MILIPWFYQKDLAMYIGELIVGRCVELFDDYFSNLAFLVRVG